MERGVCGRWGEGSNCWKFASWLIAEASAVLISRTLGWVLLLGVS